MANQSEGETDFQSENLTESAQAAYASATEGGEAMKDTATASGAAAKDEAEASLHDSEAEYDEWVTKAEFAIIDHPLAAVGVAFAAGWLASKLFR